MSMAGIGGITLSPGPGLCSHPQHLVGTALIGSLGRASSLHGPGALSPCGVRSLHMASGLV